MNDIKCNVSNCVYHSGVSTCTAKEIQVASQCTGKPCECSETECGRLNRRTDRIEKRAWMQPSTLFASYTEHFKHRVRHVLFLDNAREPRCFPAKAA